MSAINKYDRGSNIVLQSQVSKTPAFEDAALHDPTTITGEVSDQEGTIRKVATAMTKYATGKYSLPVQTLTTWPIGIYSFKIVSTGTGYSDVTIEDDTFELI